MKRRGKPNYRPTTAPTSHSIKMADHLVDGPPNKRQKLTGSSPTANDNAGKLSFCDHVEFQDIFPCTSNASNTRKNGQTVGCVYSLLQCLLAHDTFSFHDFIYFCINTRTLRYKYDSSVYFKCPYLVFVWNECLFLCSRCFLSSLLQHFHKTEKWSTDTTVFWSIGIPYDDNCFMFIVFGFSR